MPGDSSLERLVSFEACFNFRDVGGYATKDGRTVQTGKLFRSDSLHRLTETDLSTFRQLQLRTVLDLRAQSEIDEFGRLRDEARRELQWRHLPMIDEVILRIEEPGATAPVPPVDAAGRSYLDILGDGAVMAQAFSVLSNGMPAVVHCTSGKDRTGMVVALALDLLGVPDPTIAADYEMTNASRARAAPWIEQHEPTFAAFLGQIPAARRMARGDTILEFLSGVRAEHGSAQAFLRSKGLGASELAAFRHGLVG